MKKTAPFLIMAIVLIMTASPSEAQNRDAAPVMAAPGDTPTAFENPELVGRYLETITADDLAAHLYFFASDFFEGRETTTRGQKMAAEYLASQYRRMGVSPRGTTTNANPRSPSAYFQPLPLYGSRFDRAELFLGGSSEPDHVFGGSMSDGSFMTMFGGSGEVAASVVFAGYGIGDDELGYNDFAALDAAGIDYNGKWVMILADEPMQDAETSLLPTEDHALSSWSTGRFNKLRPMFNGEEQVPAGILMVGDLSPREGSVHDAAMETASTPAGVGSLSLDPPSGPSRSRFPTVLSISAELGSKLPAGI